MAVRNKKSMEELFNQIRSGNIDTNKIDFSDLEEDNEDYYTDDRMEQIYDQIRTGNIDMSKIDFGDDTKEVGIQEQDTSGWFKKSRAFEDDKGNILSDAAKTVFGTVGDIGTGIIKGVMNIGEGIGDTITYGIAQYKENKGDIERANQLRKKAQVNLMDKIFEPVKDKVDENSVLGDKSDNIVEGLGYVAGMTAVGILTGGAGAGVSTAAISSTTFTSAMGQGMSQAYEEGANNDDAWKFGLISGLAETGSELLFGGLGKATGAVGLSKGITSIDDALAKKVSGIFKTTLGKNLSEYVIKAGAEGSEEVISGFLQALGQKMTYKSDKELKTLVKDQHLLEQFVSGAITSAIAQVPGQNGIYKTTKNSRDFITGLTQNEAKVYDKELSTRADEQIKNKAIEKAYNEQIETQEKLGIKLSEEDRNTIRQAVEDAYNSGRIKTDEKISSKIYDELEQNVKRDLEEGNISIDTIRNTIGENQDIRKDKLLQKSLYEEEQKNVAYQVQKTDNEKVNVLYQSAADSGMNNNNVTRKKIELVAKLTKDTNRQYKFVSPEQLKEMGYNENANGLINKETGEILINSRSEKGLQSVIGHETTHIFDTKNENEEYTQEYKDLQDYVIEYAKEKGIFTQRVKDIIKNYDGVVDNYNQVKEELTADLIGDFIFNDSQFIEQLSTENRNVFQKIYDYIKHSLKLATAGSKEARQLENIKYQFDKVYRTIAEETSADTKYSIGGKEAVNNIKDNSQLYNEAVNNYNKAKSMANNNIDNEQIRKDTGWFQDRTGKWKFEISDKNMALNENIKLETKRTYKLGNILKHDTLFTLYPSLAKMEVQIQDTNKYIGNYNKNDNRIYLSSSILGNPKKVEKTLIHEIQHTIQNIEGFETGITSKLSKKTYYENLGEIEADNVSKRFIDEKYRKININDIAPESSKQDPKHRNYEKYMKNRGTIDKIKDSVFKYSKKDGNSYEINQENLEQNDEKTIRDSNEQIWNRLDNENSEKSSFNLKQKQLNIINKTNPMLDDYHTGIRNIEDIKTLQETIQDNEWSDYDEFNPDLTRADLEDAIETGKITVYSSYPIKQGVFVSPSYMEAESYSGDGKVYSKEVNIKDVAWIDPTQGQYANTNSKYSMTNVNNITGDDIAIKDMQKREKNPVSDNYVGQYEESGKNIDTTEKTTNENSSKTNLKTKARNYISRSKTKFKNDVVTKFGTSKIANTNLLNSTVESIQNDIIDNGKLNNEQINKYFNELYDNLKKIDTAYYDEYKDVKEDIKNIRFYVPENVKGSISDYNDFRQNNMGNIIMTNNPDNINIDAKYKELSEMYPELFPDDVTNQSDQLIKIAEVTKDIAKVETNVSAYNDKYMGKEYRKWAKEEFGTAISNLTKDIHDAMRYNKETKLEDKIKISKEEVKEVYKQIPEAKKKYERTLNKEVLTKNDRIQVDRLINGEIDISELPKDSNQDGIIRLATAKSEYSNLKKLVDNYVKDIKKARIDEAQTDVGDLNRWKDKKIGFQYSRETPIRNIYDVAPKNIADNIVNKYFRSYIEVNEKKVIDNIHNYNEQIKELDIGTKNKYKIDFDGQTRRVSESALVQLLGEKKISTQQIKEAGADVFKIENAVNKFRNIYNELINKINDSMLENGYAPMEYRKDYFPHFTEEKPDTLLGKAAKLIGIDISNKDNLPTDISGQTMNFKPGRTWFSNMLQRTTEATDYDALKGFDKYIRGASDLIYHTNDIQNLRALSTVIRGTYNDTEIQNKVLEIQESTSMSELEKSEAIKSVYETAKDRSHLSKFIEWLDNYTNILAGKKSINDRGLEKELNRKMYSTMQSVESRFAANAIGGNIGVALTNFAPLAQATGEVRTSNLIAGMWQTMKCAITGDTNFVSESQFITRRRGSEYLYQSTTDKITNLLTSPLEFADNFTSESIVRAKYIQNMKEGMTEQTALEEADRYTAGLMADRGRGALPTQFNNKNPLAKMINMFQVEVNNQWSYYFKDLPRNVQENGKNNLVAAYSKIMVGSYLINELLGSIRGNSTRVLPDPIYIIKELIKGLSDDDDDNDSDTILSTLSEIAGNLPFVSLPATLLGASDIGRVPLTGMVPDLSEIVGNVTDVANSKKTLEEGAKDISKELLNTLGSSLILPFGGAQIKKTIKGLDLYSEDKPIAGSYTDKGDLKYTVDEDVGSKIKSALFGAYANPYAEEYIKSGYKSIKSNNIDELVALGMNSTEYRNFKKELSKVSDTSDKNGYKQYVDKNNNVYWFDDKNGVMYDSNYKETNLTDDDLTKVSKKEEALNYINALDLTDNQKNIIASNIDKTSKKTIDMKEYSKYDSYDEYKFSRDHPEKYSVINQIASYDDYLDYKKDIKEISDEYKLLSDDATNSKQKSNISKQKKKEIQSYIESLPLNQYQKMMMEKEAGYSIKSYKGQIYQYLESQNLSNDEKYNIWKELFE